MIATELVTSLETSLRLKALNLRQDTYWQWRKASAGAQWILRSQEWFKLNPTAKHYELVAAFTISELTPFLLEPPLCHLDHCEALTPDGAGQLVEFIQKHVAVG